MYISVQSILSLLKDSESLLTRQEKWACSVRISSVQTSALTLTSVLVQARSYAVRKLLLWLPSRVSAVSPVPVLRSLQLRVFSEFLQFLIMLKHTLTLLRSSLRVLIGSHPSVQRIPRVLRYSLSAVRSTT